MAASGLQPKLASRARLEDELGKLPAQQIAAGRLSATVRAPLRMTAPSRWISHDFPTTRRSPRRAGEWSIAADQADADMRRCLRQQFRGGIAEAALIKDQEVEPAEV